MTRTVKGKKAPGSEYWSRRGYPSVRMAEPGKTAKRATHRAERRQAKDDMRREDTRG